MNDLARNASLAYLSFVAITTVVAPVFNIKQRNAWYRKIEEAKKTPMGSILVGGMTNPFTWPKIAFNMLFGVLFVLALIVVVAK